MSPLKNIDDCFERGLLSQDGARQDPGAGNIQLLAVFHSARAVLFRDGVREKSHYRAHIGLSIFRAKAFAVVGYTEKRVEV